MLVSAAKCQANQAASLLSTPASARADSDSAISCQPLQLLTRCLAQASVLEAYGSAAAKKPEELALLGQSEGYVEYNKQGRIVKGHAQPVSRPAVV